jgi:hypothetical protein
VCSTISDEKSGKSKLSQIVTKALHLLRDVYGQFFVLLMDTLIQKPFLFLLNKTKISNHKRWANARARN